MNQNKPTGASELTREMIESLLSTARSQKRLTIGLNDATFIALCEHYLRTTDEAIVNAPGYPWLPCPICHGVEGCSDTVPERMAAATDEAREEGVADAMALDPAPSSNLPSWGECQLRVHNSEYIAQRVKEGGYGAESDDMLASELHHFIYEYDCTNEYTSKWWRHRLEKLLNESATLRRQRANEGKVREPVPDWMNRNADSLGGWVNELGTLSEHRDSMPGWLRSAIRTIYHGLMRHTRASPLQPAANERTTAGEERRVERILHDYPRLQEFFTKHALGAKLAPSCFGCGGAWKTWEGTTRHLELMDVYLCPQCAKACASPSSAPAVSDGWQVVPKEPTREMMLAAHERSRDGTTPMYHKTWAAMLAAAPSPEGKV